MVDYLRLAECCYAFLGREYWLRTDTIKVLDEEAYRALPKKVQAVCLPLPRADEEDIRRTYFESINNLILYKKYQRMRRIDKDPETVERHFWWMLIDEGLSEEYRGFLERYLIDFGKNWCREQGILCTDKPMDRANWREENTWQRAKDFSGMDGL